MRYLIAVVTILVSLLLLPSVIFSHGADTFTASTVLLPKEGGREGVKVSLSVPVAVAILVPEEGTKGENPADIDYWKYKVEYVSYIERNFSVLSTGEKCSFDRVDMPEVSTDQLMFGSGLMFDIDVICSNGYEDLVITNTMFIDQLHHTNSITVYRGDFENIIQASLLTKDVTSMKVGNIEDGGKRDLGKFGGNMFNKLTEGLDSAPLPLLLGIVFALGLLHTLEAGHSKTILGGLLISKKVNLKQAIAYSSIFTATHIAPILVLGIILLVASTFIDVYERLPYLQIFSLYALFFISLFLVLRSLADYVQTVVAKYRHRIAHRKGEEHSHEELHVHSHTHNHSGEGDSHTHTHSGSTHSHHNYDSKKGFGEQLLMGFVAGLAPCLFGWSIFMVVLSTRSVAVLFPVIISFALGIFLALSLFAFVVWKLKKNFIKEGSMISELSPVISSAILLVYSISLIL